MPNVGTFGKRLCAQLGAYPLGADLGTFRGMENNLRALRKMRGWTQTQAAEAMGTTRDQYVKLERGVAKGGRKLHELWISKAAAAFGVEPSEIIAPSDRQVPVVGYVGAGDLEHRFGEGQGEVDTAPAPRGASERTVAVEVRGDSLGPFFDRALIFYDERFEPFDDSLLGQLCVVGLRDGQVLVKQVRRGSAPGRFTLYGQFGSPVEDAEIIWAAPVLTVTPRLAKGRAA